MGVGDRICPLAAALSELTLDTASAAAHLDIH